MEEGRKEREKEGKKGEKTFVDLVQTFLHFFSNLLFHFFKLKPNLRLHGFLDAVAQRTILVSKTISKI